MLSWLYPAARAGLFMLAPEDAHAATLNAMEAGLYPRGSGTSDPLLAQRVFGPSLGPNLAFLNEERWLLPVIGLVGLAAPNLIRAHFERRIARG